MSRVLPGWQLRSLGSTAVQWVALRSHTHTHAHTHTLSLSLWITPIADGMSIHCMNLESVQLSRSAHTARMLVTSQRRETPRRSGLGVLASSRSGSAYDQASTAAAHLRQRDTQSQARTRARARAHIHTIFHTHTHTRAHSVNHFQSPPLELRSGACSR